MLNCGSGAQQAGDSHLAVRNALEPCPWLLVGTLDPLPLETGVFCCRRLRACGASSKSFSVLACRVDAGWVWVWRCVDDDVKTYMFGCLAVLQAVYIGCAPAPGTSLSSPTRLASSPLAWNGPCNGAVNQSRPTLTLPFLHPKQFSDQDHHHDHDLPPRPRNKQYSTAPGTSSSTRHYRGTQLGSTTAAVQLN